MSTLPKYAKESEPKQSKKMLCLELVQNVIKMTDEEFDELVRKMTPQQMEEFVSRLSENQLLPHEPYPATPSCDPQKDSGTLEES